MPPEDDPAQDPNDNPVFRFLHSKTFKYGCLVLAALGVIYGIGTGTLTSSRVSAPKADYNSFNKPSPWNTQQRNNR